MKHKLILILSLFFINSYPQSVLLKNKCDSILGVYNYTEALDCYYKRHYDINEINKKYYNIAICYARLKQIDSAFFYINRFKDEDSSLRETEEPAFVCLYSDSRWQKYISELFVSLEEINPSFDSNIVKPLYGVYQRDQEFRGELSYRTNLDSDSLIALQEKNDSINLLIVTSFLEENGWPEYEKMGDLFGSHTFFMVLQHANLEVQKKYIPMIIEAARNGNASWIEYAYMKDRILVGEGKKQQYGTQFRYDNRSKKYELFPIDDPNHLNDRRMEVGLPYMEGFP